MSKSGHAPIVIETSASPRRAFSTTIWHTHRHHEPNNPSHMATGSVAESAHTCAYRSAARRDVPAAVDVDSDFVLRRSGDLARVAADCGGADACRSHADGPADGDGNRALRVVLAADGRVARPCPETTGVRGRRTVDCVRRRGGAGGVVVRLVVDALAVLCR